MINVTKGYNATLSIKKLNGTEITIPISNIKKGETMNKSTDDQFKEKINSGNVDDIVDAVKLLIETAKEQEGYEYSKESACQGVIMLLYEVLKIKRKEIIKKNPTLKLARELMKITAKGIMQ